MCIEYFKSVVNLQSVFNIDMSAIGPDLGEIGAISAKPTCQFNVYIRYLQPRSAINTFVSPTIMWLA
jgi:hypothetical protein